MQETMHSKTGKYTWSTAEMTAPIGVLRKTQWWTEKMSVHVQQC